MAKQKDKLSALQVKQAKAPDGKAQVKLTDGAGMYLLVNKQGKYWRMDYRHGGKRKTMALGAYPECSLSAARAAREAAREIIQAGFDPMAQKQAEVSLERQKQQADIDTFQHVAEEWLGKQANIYTPSHAADVRSRLGKHIFPWIGATRIADIEPADLLAVLRRIEARGKHETTHRMKGTCSQVFRYAVATGRAKRDPTPDLRGALTPVRQTHRAKITDPIKMGVLLRDLQAFEGTFVVRCALLVTPYLFAKPTELRHAEWSEVNLDDAVWVVPAEKMKMRRKHIVPLARQVVDILRDLQSATGSGRYLLPSIRNASRPLSENTINAALRRLGYDKNTICAHGFRGMASTILHEQGFNSDVIERQLAHVEGNQVKAAYNAATHLPERTKLMQHWADYLDGLRDGATVISINRKRA